MTEDSSPTRDEPAIARCVGILLDDHARQGGHLSLDDVTRIVLRLRLSPSSLARVLELIKANGVQIADVAMDDTRTHESETTDTSVKQGRTSSSNEASTIRGSDLLTHADEIRLGRRYQAARGLVTSGEQISDSDRTEIIESGMSARSQLILSNVRLVVHYAKQYATSNSLSLDDLIQEGFLGLFRAIDKWEPDRGFRFSTYATWWIHQFIARSISVRGRIVRLPEHINSRVRALRQKTRKLFANLGRMPTEEQLSRELGYDLSEIYFLQRLQRDAQSLDVGLDGSERSSLQSRVASHTEAPDAALDREELSGVLLDVLKTLDSRWRRILILRFGLNGRKPRTLEQISKRFGVTRERIRQIEKKALEKIANTPRRNALTPYLDTEE